MWNIMITNRTAKMVHIDLSDCFGVAMNRGMFPEKWIIDRNEKKKGVYIGSVQFTQVVQSISTIS
jgi:hypothetical protein